MSCFSHSSFRSIRALFTPSSLALEKTWLEIRDMFFGRNCVKQDIVHALKLAASCEHPEAKYLTSLFAGKTVETEDEARAVFLRQPETDARALCFGEVLLPKSSKKCSIRYFFKRKNEKGGAHMFRGFHQWVQHPKATKKKQGDCEKRKTHEAE